MEPYAPRPIRFTGITDFNGFRLKTYAIVYGGGDLDRAVYEGAWRLIERALPQPAVTPERPGVGFVICHTGRGMHYTVLGWWDRENELPLRVFVREFADGASWRPAQGSESVCVWDLEVIGFERDAYVATALRADGGVEAYLRQVKA